MGLEQKEQEKKTADVFSTKKSEEERRVEDLINSGEKAVKQKTQDAELAPQIKESEAYSFRNESLEFIHTAELIRDLSYTSDKFFIRWKRSNSADMQAIINGVEAFKLKLDDSLNEDDSPEVDEKKLDAKQKEFEEALERISADSDYYINTHNPKTREGKIRKDLVVQIRDNVKADKTRIKENMAFLKRTMGKEIKRFTWRDILRLSRTARYENGKDGVKVSAVGAGTTSLYVVEKDGEKRFFKKREEIYTPDQDGNWRAYLDSCAEVEKRIEESTDHDSIHYKEDLVRREVLRALSTMRPERLHEELPNVFSNDDPDLIVSSMLCPELKELLRQYKQEDAEAKAKEEENAADNTEEKTAAFYKVPMFLVTLKELAKKNNLIVQVKSAKLKPGTELTARNVATTRLADALGISDFIARSDMAEVIIDGEAVEGIVMEEAKGVTIEELLQKKSGMEFHYSPLAMKQLSCLQIFDVLCGQADRHMGNYHVEYHETGNQLVIDSIVAFDNDLSFGMIDRKQYLESLTGNTFRAPQRKRNGKEEFTCPCIDLEFAMKMDTLTPDFLDYLLSDIISDEEMKVLKERLAWLQEVFVEAAKQGVMYSDSADENIPGWSSFVTKAESLTDKDKIQELFEVSYINGWLCGKVV